MSSMQRGVFRVRGPVGVVSEGPRGEVWRAVAMQAHLLDPSFAPSRARSVGWERRVAQPASDGRACDLDVYASVQYEEKLRRHKASLTLAQRMGLVHGPVAPLSPEEWEAVKRVSESREDSAAPCSICLDDFRQRPQVILSCSHVFHAECIRSFELFSGTSRRCPLCRQSSYDATLHHGGFMVWRHKCAGRIQRAWRGYRARADAFKQLRDPTVRVDAPALHKLLCGRAMQAVGSRMVRACEDREHAVNRFFESLETSVAESSQQLREGLVGFEHLHPSMLSLSQPGRHTHPQDAHALNVAVPSWPDRNWTAKPTNWSVDAEAWAQARRAALQRGDERQEVDCPICFQICQLRGGGAARVELLSCSHVFHRCCVASFESFHVFEVHVCPVCRQQYKRRPWQHIGRGSETQRQRHVSSISARCSARTGVRSSGSDVCLRR